MKAGNNAMIQNITVHETGGNGIDVQHEGRIDGCHVTLTVNDGIQTSEDGIVTGSTVFDAGGDGVQVARGSIVRDSIARSSVGAGLSFPSRLVRLSLVVCWVGLSLALPRAIAAYRAEHATVLAKNRPVERRGWAEGEPYQRVCEQHVRAKHRR